MLKFQIEKTKNIYCIEDKDYPKIENAYYGEWEILYSETVTNEGKAYMQNGDRVIIKEDEIVIEGDVLKNIRFDGTLASNLDGREYFDFFKEKLACRLIYWFVQRFHTVKCVKFKSVYLSPGRQFKFHKDQFFRN